MNPLESYPGARKALYLIQFVVAGAILLFGVGFTAAGAGFPQWYVVASAVASALWAYLGLQAAQNTPAPRRNERGEGGFVALPFRGASRDRTLPGKARVRARRMKAERGHADVSLFLGVACLVLLIVVLVRVL